MPSILLKNHVVVAKKNPSKIALNQILPKYSLNGLVKMYAATNPKTSTKHTS
jgi:hypothetical protein